MATLKHVRMKIKGIKKTKQITKAMNMVAASRLRGAQQRMSAFRPYANKFAEVLSSLAERASEGVSSLIEERETVNTINIVLCTSDRGLCGGFNSNLISKAEALISEKAKNGAEISFTCFGKKGRDWCKRNSMKIRKSHIGVVGTKFNFNIASTEGRSLIDDFLIGNYDEVYVIYSEFISMAKQIPVLKKLLPIPPIESEEKKITAEESKFLPEHICEPSPQELMEELLPKNVYIQLHKALLETSTSEHAARMYTMDNATKACNDMVNNLTLLLNKARQSAITAELMDIVGGAEALKG
ncbi:MAG: ATP synthase F1 subunit gamma [Desulfobacterales bacterium]|nr:ATP synthase F1 subunit gamma [Desulfobacterales bacterium]